MTAHNADDIYRVALAILQVSAPEAKTSDLTDRDLDEAKAALDVIYGPQTIRSTQ